MANAGTYTGATKAIGDVLVDFRSDTVTRPTAAMRAVMAKADVGDDVYGDDPNVNDLQDKVAALMGKEAALFVTSGTQSNLCAMLAHCQRGQEILTGENYHVFIDEAGGASVLGGIMMAPMPTNDTGALDIDDIDKTVKPDDPHCPISSLLCLENTVSGNVQSVASIDALALRGKAHGLSVHLDGARLMNAVVKLDVPVCDIVKNVDSVSLCLSKGLGAPVGSVLAGSKELISRAYRVRKLVGGGLRQ
ncbi:MAG: low-specificity L-threonine aldolase, partial [Candidatus Puniceispirillum sp.]|nr:low-specificity L-threonine aldolase [Candidatus Puniceispirillum sp.]